MVLTTGVFLFQNKIVLMDSPTLSVTKITPEFDSIVSKDYCLPTPYVIDLSDAQVLSEPIPLTAVEQTVASLQEGIVNCSEFPKGLSLFSGPNVEQRTVKCREVLNSRKNTLEQHVQNMGTSAVMTEVLVPSICHLYWLSALTQLELTSVWKNLGQLNDFCNSIGSQLESSIANVNETNNGIMSLINPIMEQVRYNASDIRTLVLENTLRQSNLLALQSQIGSEVTHVKDQFNALENNMAFLRQLSYFII